MTVYVVNQSGHDVSSAEKYGEIKILTEGKVNVFATDRLIVEMKGKLDEAQPNDFLLLSGYSLINIIASMILYTKYGKVNFLIYNFTTKEYSVREVKDEIFKG